MPLLGTRGAASARGFGFLSLGDRYWIATLGGASNDNGYGIAVDSSGNCYVTGYDNTTNPGSLEVLITKYDTSGVIQWQRVLGGVNNDRGYGIAVDSSGNCYVTGFTSSAGAGNADVLITKYNASGTIQWQRVLGGASTDVGQGIAVDSSDNCYVVGTTYSAGAGNGDVLVTKYNTSGTIQWQRVLGGANTDEGYGICVDSNGNCYIAGYDADNPGASTELLIAKYDTSGTIQWKRKLGGSPNQDNGYGIVVDSSGNSYVVGYTRNAGSGLQDALIAKYDTSGVIQWQRVLGGANSDFAYGVAVDSSGNCYITGYTESTGAGGADVLIAKYNTSGTIQWQRVLGGGSGDVGYGIAVDSNGNCYVTGYTNSAGAGSEDALIARLPGDGSKTGTYGPWTYQASSLTAATSSLTAATSSLTAATSTLTAATSSLTAATSTLTSTVTQL